jgi:5'-nucleotidase / UDP-sugar diphosphatase
MTLTRLLLASTALGLSAQTAAAEFTLHILHINDFHSRIESINAFDSTCSAEDETEGECFGGVARLKTAIDAKRAELDGQNVVLLDAGDQFQGSLYFTTYSGQAEVEFMNLIGFDAMVFGNHEFNLGPDPLADFVEKAEFPVVYGNVDASGDNRLGPLDKDPVILEVGGERVAIVGAVTTDVPEISSPGPTIGFGDPIAYLTETVAALEADGIRHIVALTHVGTPEDLRIAAAVPGLDVIVGGHSHTLFSNTAEGAPYAYPHFVEGPDGRQVPIVQVGAYSKYLGHLTLTFDDDGNVTAAEGDAMLLDAAVTPDEAVLARVRELAEPIQELMSEIVAEVAADIDGSRETCRAMECEMGNLVADAMLDRTRGQGVTIALQNGGGLRASIAGGTVTKGDVLAVLPFQNTLSTFNIAGSGIVAALENGFSQVEEGAGRFPQVAGLKVTWDPKAEPGSRVREVLVEDGGAWVPIDPEKVYAVATNNFMRNGGDGYSVLLDQGQNAYDFGPGLEDVLADYLAAQQDYMPFTDGRITAVE